MIKKLRVIVIEKRVIILTVIFFLVCFGFICLFINFYSKSNQVFKTQQNSRYVILTVNDLGMHCYMTDYADFMILPPGNNLKVQIFRNEGNEARLINSGVEVSYQIIDNTTSADKINFWEYAKDYGFDVAPNIGISGNGLRGKIVLSTDGKYYEATAIPVTPYNDGKTELNPYQLAIVRVVDSKAGSELAMIDNVVIPVSNEMDCYICHGTTDTGKDILEAHDEISKTNLVADLEKGKRYKCSDCHQDNILSTPKVPGILPLSEAIHGFHADKMKESNYYSAMLQLPPRIHFIML